MAEEQKSKNKTKPSSSSRKLAYQRYRMEGRHARNRRRRIVRHLNANPLDLVANKAEAVKVPLVRNGRGKAK